jgi:hypothetical protein
VVQTNIIYFLHKILNEEQEEKEEKKKKKK